MAKTLVGAKSPETPFNEALVESAEYWLQLKAGDTKPEPHQLAVAQQAFRLAVYFAHHTSPEKSQHGFVDVARFGIKSAQENIAHKDGVAFPDRLRDPSETLATPKSAAWHHRVRSAPAQTRMYAVPDQEAPVYVIDYYYDRNYSISQRHARIAAVIMKRDLIMPTVNPAASMSA